MIITEIDQIRIPVCMTVLSQKRCIRSHADHIGITLYIAKIKSLSQSSLHITPFCRSGSSILTKVYLRGMAVITVIIVLIMHKPSCTFIIMLIHHINDILMILCKLPPFLVVRRTFMEWSYSSAHFYFRVFLFDSLTNHHIALLAHGWAKFLIPN